MDLGMNLITLEVKNVSVNFSAVDFGVVPLYTVRGFFGAEFIECLQEIFIASDLIFLNEVVNALIILNPEHYIPGLIIGPTVIGFIGDAGLVSGGRHLRFVCVN